MQLRLQLLCFLSCLLSPFFSIDLESASAEPVRQFGFARLEITPKLPLRLSGYGNRTEPFTAIDHPLWARAMAIQERDGKRFALISTLQG